LSYQEKGALVDELVELSGFHRKSVLRLLRQQPADHGGPPARANAGHDSAEVGRSRRYGPEVVQLLETLWEASDHLCGKRLAAVLPTLMTALERHGHWHVDPNLRQKLLRISPATIDRLLAPARSAQGGKHRRRRTRIVTGVRRRTTVRTFNGWKDVVPGWFEMDLVAHCGGRMEGPFLWTLVLTDVASGWSECVPLPSRDGLLVRSALQELQTLMPLPLRGLDVDNDTAVPISVALTTSWWNGCGGLSSMRRCTSGPMRMAGMQRSAWPAFSGGTAMQDLTDHWEAELPMWYVVKPQPTHPAQS
jgi:hypothetical protein